MNADYIDGRINGGGIDGGERETEDVVERRTKVSRLGDTIQEAAGFQKNSKGKKWTERKTRQAGEQLQRHYLLFESFER